MLGYLLFIVPMAAAFSWLAARYGIRQALLDLIAFNLLFDFDFAALLPGNVRLTVVQLLGIVFVGYESIGVFQRGHIRLPRRTVIALSAATIFVLWLVVATYLNKDWDFSRITIFVTRLYILSTLYIFVGIRLAKSGGLVRFGKIVLLSAVLVGVISVIQTASNGRLLTNDVSDNYLGIFQPLGDKAIAYRDLTQEEINFVSVVKTIHFGNFSFYRAAGAFDGAYAILCITAIIAFCWLVSKEKVSFWLFAPFLLSLIGFILAFNRTSIIAFAVAAAGILFIRFRSLFSRRVIIRWVLPISMVALIAIALIGPISTVVAATLDGFFGNRGERDVGTLTGRTTLWLGYVLPQIVQNPIIGTGQPVTVARAGWGTDDNPAVDIGTHNGFLEFAYRGGIFPALIFILLVLFCLLRSFGLSRNRRLTSAQRTFFLALSSSILGFILLNLTDPLMSTLQIAALFWVCCGYLATYNPQPGHGPVLSM